MPPVSEPQRKLFRWAEANPSEAAARGTRLHVAITGTRMAAMILALARPGLTIVEPGGEAEALAPMAIGIIGKIDHDDRTQRPRRPQRKAILCALCALGVPTW